MFDDASPPIESRANAAVDKVVNRFTFVILIVLFVYIVDSVVILLTRFGFNMFVYFYWGFATTSRSCKCVILLGMAALLIGGLLFATVGNSWCSYDMLHQLIVQFLCCQWWWCQFSLQQWK